MKRAGGFAIVLCLLAALVGCGSYTGTGGQDAVTGSPGDAGPVGSCSQLFTQRVQPRLAFCRNCHVPGGIADVDAGRKFLLSPTAGADDYDKLRASWDLLKDESGSGPSRILTMASGTDSHTHAGGAPWPLSGAAYADMKALLDGFADPSACVLGSADTTTDWPLLGSAHGGHRWVDFCEAHRGEAGWRDLALPADPRSLVRVNGVNTGKNVYFNAWWKDCHVDVDGDGNAELVAEKAHPKPAARSTTASRAARSSWAPRRWSSPTAASRSTRTARR